MVIVDFKLPKMNRIVILCIQAVTLLQFTTARVTRDVSLGYNYHPDQGSAGSGGLQAPASSNSYYNTIGTSGFVPSTQTYLINNGFGIGGGGGGLSYTSSSSSSSLPQYNYDGQYNHYNQIQQHEPTVTKHFYIHSAPEDHDEQQIVRYINVGRPRKNYNVVFVRAPTSSVSKAKIIANVAPTEDKTAIYVLTKKTNALDVAAEVITPPPKHNKPDVYFLKYKTPAEAHHAQHVIQAQYNALGGTSHVSDEGLSSVSSVIGSLGGTDSTGNVETAVVTSHGNADVNAINAGGDNTQQVYLPPHQG